MIKINITEKLLNETTHRFHKVVKIFGIKIFEKVFDSSSNELIEEYTPKNKPTIGFNK